MRLYWLCALIVAASWPLGGRAAASESAPERGYARLEAMDAQARAAWSETMLKRLDEANRVVLDAGAVAAQHTRLRQMLAPLLEDRAGWQSQVSRFEEELALSQRAAVEHLTRRYRMEAYQKFHADRPRYDERRSLLAQLLERWRKAGSPDAEQHKVVDWLAAATEPKNDRLPPLPNFAGQARPAERSLVRSEPSWLRSGPSTALPEVRLPLSGVSAGEVVPLSGPYPARLLADRAAPATGWDMVRPTLSPASLEVRLPLDVHRSAPRPLHAAMRPSLEEFGSPAATESAKVASFSRDSWRRPPSVAGVTRPTSKPRTPVADRPTSASSGGASDPLAFARTSVDRLTLASTTAGRSTFTGRAGGSQAVRTEQPTSTPAGYARPRSTGVSLSSPPSRDAAPEGDSVASIEPDSATAASRPAGQPDESSLPNVSELASRIKGNNVALRNLAAQLYEERRWDAKSLSTMLDQLAPLVARKDDLKLIRELVPAQERRRVGDLESGSDLISDLGSKIARARSLVEDGKFQGTLAERKAELEKLDVLSRRLAQLVFSDE